MGFQVDVLSPGIFDSFGAGMVPGATGWLEGLFLGSAGGFIGCPGCCCGGGASCARAEPAVNARKAAARMAAEIPQEERKLRRETNMATPGVGTDLETDCRLLWSYAQGIGSAVWQTPRARARPWEPGSM